MKFSKLLENRRVKADEVSDLNSKTVNIARVAKVVKGGRRFSFSALVVSGDGKGHVGFGLGKAGEVPDALRKATDNSKNRVVKVPLRGSTIPHDTVGYYGPTKVVMKAAAPGTGVIAGSAVRAVLELAGIKDIRTKIVGSSNVHNVLHAVFTGLIGLRDPQSVASKRAIPLEQIGYSAF